MRAATLCTFSSTSGVLLQGKHKLHAERKACGKTQKQLGAEAGVSPSTISNIECHRGPDVPPDQLRETKTRLATALKLAVVLQHIAAGEYTIEEFVRAQSLFTEAEIYEAIENELKREQARERRRRAKAQRHLHAVA